MAFILRDRQMKRIKQLHPSLVVYVGTKNKKEMRGEYGVRLRPAVTGDIGWRTYSVALGVVTLTLIAICAASLWFSVDAEHRQNAQELVLQDFMTQEQSDVNALVSADAALATELVDLNTTIQGELAFLAAALNLTSVNGNTFAQQVEQQIASSVATLETELGLRLVSVNGVSGDNATHNLDLIAGVGIQVVPHPLTHAIDVINSGVLRIESSGPGLSFSSATGNVVATNTGVISVSGITPPALSGNIELLGTGMISVLVDVNASTLTVDGSAIVTVLSNLQAMDMTQQSEINDLQLNVTTLQQEIDNVQTAGAMIAEALNGTTITFNMTLMELMTGLLQAQADIVALQAQLANVTAIVTPPGVMMPWTGAMSTAPSGYLLCDGSEYAAVSYPDLFAVVGTMYCNGNCSMSAFRVPDMRGMVPAAQSSSGAFNAAVGTALGVEQQTLTTPNLPSHTHSASTDAQGSHTHSVLGSPIGNIHIKIDAGDGSGATSTHTPPTGIFSSGFNTCDQSGLAINNCEGVGNYPGGNPTFSTILATEAQNAGLAWGEHIHVTDSQGSHTHTVNVGSTGSGAAFSIVQPTLVVQYIIKT